MQNVTGTGVILSEGVNTYDVEVEVDGIENFLFCSSTLKKKAATSIHLQARKRFLLSQKQYKKRYLMSWSISI
jgi:hypothetical protein